MRPMRSLIAAVLLTGCAAHPPDPPAPVAGAAVPPRPSASTSSEDVIPLASNAVAVKASSKDPTEVICRREPVANTRLGGQRVCMRREDWDRRADAASEAWREQQRPAMPVTGD